MVGVVAVKLCFVIGPIGEESSTPRIHADWLLEGIIEPVMAEFPGFIVKRADQDPRPGLIDAQLINDLLNAELVIADLSFLNPNVYYEIGIRHMAQKPIIHMQLANEKPPFDLSLYRAIKFSREKYSDLASARNALKEAVEAVLSRDYVVENPVTNARGRIKLSEHATSEQKVVIDQLEALDDRMEMLEDHLKFWTEQVGPRVGLDHVTPLIRHPSNKPRGDIPDSDSTTVRFGVPVATVELTNAITYLFANAVFKETLLGQVFVEIPKGRYDHERVVKLAQLLGKSVGFVKGLLVTMD